LSGERAGKPAAAEYVELHFHLLPGVDDGPPTMADSVALARAAIADGTRLVVATPHVHADLFTDPGGILEHTERLRERLRAERVQLDVLPGGELDHRVAGRLSQAQLELIAQGPSGRRWLLLEAPFGGLPAEFAQVADDLRRSGFAAVIAHPERARPTPAGDAILRREIELGSALQLTAASLNGGLGEQAREQAKRLLALAPRVVVASDAHGPSRMPALTGARRALIELGVRDPSRYLAAAPRSLLEDGLEIWPSAEVA
jgi:protein-tyrosine phosphatase